jgi:hypothetical protein
MLDYSKIAKLKEHDFVKDESYFYPAKLYKSIKHISHYIQ